MDGRPLLPGVAVQASRTLVPSVMARSSARSLSRGSGVSRRQDTAGEGRVPVMHQRRSRGGLPMGLLVGFLVAIIVVVSAGASCSRNATSETSGLQGNPSQGSTLSLPAESTVATSTPTTTALAPTSGKTQRIVVYLGTANPDLSRDWQSIAVSDFPAATAHPVALQLGFSPRGSLDSLLVVAYAEEGRLLTAMALGPAGESLMVSGVMVYGVGMPASPLGTVASFMASIDEVGPQTMIAKLPSLGTESYGGYPGFYFLEAWPEGTVRQDIPSTSTAFIWDGSHLEPLAPGDSRRGQDPRYVRLVMTAYPSVTLPPAPLPDRETTTTVSVPSGPVLFVVPLPGQ